MNNKSPKFEKDLKQQSALTKYPHCHGNPSRPHYVVALTRAIRIVCFHMNLLCRTMEIIRPLRPSHLHPGSAGPRSPLTCFSAPRPGLLFVPSLLRDQPNGFYI